MNPGTSALLLMTSAVLLCLALCSGKTEKVTDPCHDAVLDGQRCWHPSQTLTIKDGEKLCLCPARAAQ